MSIVFFEGFDLYGNWGNTEQDPLVRREMWRSSETINGTSFQPRNNGNAMRLDTTNTDNLTDYTFINLKSQNTLGLTHFVCGFAFMKESPGSEADSFTPILVQFDDEFVASFVRVEVVRNPADFNLRFILYDFFGSKYVVDQSVPSFEAGIFHYVEIDIKLDAQAHFKAWVNGLQVVDEPNITVSAQFPSVEDFFIAAAKNNYHPGGIWYDDFYLLDASDASQGAQFQSRLGPIQIRPCPLTADSSPGSWVASSGGAKYLDVDEQPGPNDLDATYISTASAPQTQVFRCSPYDADLPIIAVTSFASVKQPDPTNGVAQLAFMVDSQEDASPLPLQNSYRLFSQNYVTLPGGGITVPVIQATDWGVRSLPST